MIDKFTVRIDCRIKIQEKEPSMEGTAYKVRLQYVEDLINYYIRKLLYVLEPFMENFINNEMRNY